MFSLPLLAVIFTTLNFDKLCFAQSDDGRIVGGVPTTIEEHPYQVAIQRNDSRWCGGSLIKSNVVLTAAHCVYDRLKSKYTVRGGSTFRDKGGTTARVVDMCIHPKFNHSTFDFDVAVILLDKKLTLSKRIQTIQLEKNEIPDGTLGVVTGWGHMKENANNGTEILRKVAVPKCNHSKCKKQVDAFSDILHLSDRMICFGYDEGKKDACQGDSGGPIVADGKQIGIVSWGHGCARPEIPGVYTKISNKDIHSHIDKCIADFGLL